ncbi:MAG: hypothetical protein EOO48_01505 [Flavobacterium sp.]|nr:MAG: hypothetical protein EOO48_01505 [Flavobacterium sp.]
MKNFYKSGFYFLAFLVGGMLFQISCSNTDQENNVQSAGKFVYTTKTSSVQQHIYIANIDGTGVTEVPVTLPANFVFYAYNGSTDFASARLSPDGQTVIFALMNQNTVINYIYSCNVDGSNLQQLAELPANTTVDLGNVI